MSTVHANALTTPPRKSNAHRLDNCAFAAVLVAMFALFVAMLGSVAGGTRPASAPRLASSSVHSTPPKLVLADTHAGTR